jgi:hypothetical protein
MSKHASYGAAATSEQTREVTVDELDQIAGGTPNVTANGGPLAFVVPLASGDLSYNEPAMRVWNNLLRQNGF